MKARSILLPVVLSLGLAAVCPANTKPLVVGNSRARAAAKKNAKLQMKAQKRRVRKIAKRK